MRELVEYLCKAIVEHPDQVRVNEVEGETAVIVEIRVAPDDTGRVIGRQGRIIAAIRTLARAAATRQGKRVVVEVVE
jgi:predicted RNA-binding protein YlqC (UPF0109 family)